MIRIKYFQKSKSNPLVKIITIRLASHEGEKCTKLRKTIDPPFHQEKLYLYVY